MASMNIGRKQDYLAKKMPVTLLPSCSNWFTRGASRMRWLLVPRVCTTSRWWQGARGQVRSQARRPRRRIASNRCRHLRLSRNYLQMRLQVILIALHFICSLVVCTVAWPRFSKVPQNCLKALPNL